MSPDAATPSFDWSKISLATRIAGGGAVVLLIASFLSWRHVSAGPLSASQSGWSAYTSHARRDLSRKYALPVKRAAVQAAAVAPRRRRRWAMIKRSAATLATAPGKRNEETETPRSAKILERSSPYNGPV